MTERENFGKDPKYSGNYGVFTVIDGQEQAVGEAIQQHQLPSSIEDYRGRTHEILEGVGYQINFVIENTKISKGTAIDLGSSIGAHAVALLTSGFANVIALDRDPLTFEAAGKIFEGQIEQAHFVCADYREIPLRDNSVDLALLIHSGLGALFSEEDDKKILKEARRILHPNGAFVVTFSYADFGIRYYQEHGEQLPETQIYKLVESEQNGSWITYCDVGNQTLNSEFRDQNNMLRTRVRGRMQTYQQYRDLINSVGFTIQGVWNDNEKGIPFDIESSSGAFVIARK